MSRINGRGVREGSTAGRWYRAMLALVFLAVLALLCANATRSGLWYDESIEYYYSRIASGPVPGNRDSAGMYERITDTFQPPLYNWLMHLWLSCFDSEFGFRLAGILVTLLGGAGFYLALRKMTGRGWATAGTAAYLLTARVMIYALECAEYHLVVCFVCWTLYFFLCSLMEGKRGQMAGFFLCAIGAAYSQYGAVFLILPLYAVLMIHGWKKREQRKLLVLLSLGAAAAAILLVRFFLLIQMNRQGTTGVSHLPVLRKENLIVDFLYGLYTFFQFVGGGKVPAILMALSLAAGILFLFLQKSREKKRVFIPLITAAGCAWVLYYLVTACSFYGYNAWDGPLGTWNLGGRYALFFVPALLLVCVSGMEGIWRTLNDAEEARPGLRRGVSVAFTLLLAVYCSLGIRAMLQEGNKDDVREAERLWMELGACEETTLVHERADANFQFYLTHDPGYQEEYQQRIMTSGKWMLYTTEEEVTEKLGKMGLFDLEEFWFVGPNSDFIGSYSAFLSAMERQGYEALREYEGISALIRFARFGNDT